MAGRADSRSWVAGLPVSAGDSYWGRLNKVGGTLLLDDQALVFKPLWHLGPTRRFALSELSEVVAAGTKPPRLRIVPRSGKPLVLMVTTGWMTPVWSEDVAARDDVLAAVSGVLGR